MMIIKRCQLVWISGSPDDTTPIEMDIYKITHPPNILVVNVFQISDIEKEKFDQLSNFSGKIISDKFIRPYPVVKITTSCFLLKFTTKIVEVPGIFFLSYQ